MNMNNVIKLEITRLPKEYQEVEWIGNIGNSYINTNYKFTSEIAKVKTKYLYTGLGTIRSVYGSSGNGSGGDTNWFILYCPTGYPQLNRAYIGNTPSIFEHSPLQTYAIYCDELSCNETSATRIVNGTIYNSSRTGTIISNSDICLFTDTRDNSVQSRYAHINMYYCQIYDNNELVRNMIPCYRKSDNEIGMYDTVNDVFYTNQGTGTFTKGPDCGASVKKVKSNNNVIWRLLPQQYQQVEWIRTTQRTCGVDTDYYPTGENLTARVVVEFSNDITGSVTGSSDINDHAFAYQFYSGMCYIGISRQLLPFKFIANGKYDVIIDVNNGVLHRRVNNQSETVSYSGDVYKGSSIGAVGKKQPDGFSANTALAKYFKYQLSADGKLVRYMIPCYRKSDGKIGMYDLVTDTFKEGIGVFEKGPDVN